TYMGTDPFGGTTMLRQWDKTDDEMAKAKARVHAAFEFMEKMQIPFFCFHDADISPRGDTLEETNRRLDEIVGVIKEEMARTGIKCLWGTTNAFGDDKFVHGAGTSCNASVFAYAASQIKKAMEITKELGGVNYVFWGGREGYETLLNTDTGLELDNLARLLQMAVDYAKEIGFTGQFLIEPKPKEPTKHQYDFDAATVLAFLRRYNLQDHFKMNIEANHATLAMHTFQHELNQSRINGALGSVDANMGDPMLGWDTDQFPTNIYDTTLAMYEILLDGGFTKGGLNFDAKVRRASFEADDLFYSYIAGMDAFAKGLKVAAKLIEDRVFEDFKEKRYASYKEGIGKDIVEGKIGFKELEAYSLKNGVTPNTSGRQEMLESILNQYILETK
ncbi:MAG: xylose isomerase, partial [Clostridiales bacterium]|nr:xylose isomerase [Clostridiales bacterium]